MRNAGFSSGLGNLEQNETEAEPGAQGSHGGKPERRRRAVTWAEREAPV